VSQERPGGLSPPGLFLSPVKSVSATTSTQRITIYLNARAPTSTQVGWFVLG
jgi:hypothetical protein